MGQNLQSTRAMTKPVADISSPLRRPTPVWPLVLLSIVLAAVMTALTMWWQLRPQPLPRLFAAPSFELTDQTGRTVSSRSTLAGKVWVGNFIFSKCMGPCPRMSAQMAEVARAVNSPRVHFVSFSVDPTNDTPAVLAEYEKKFDAGLPGRWSLLTEPGTSYVDIARGFKVEVRAAEGEKPIFHSVYFFLVDAHGQVRGLYNPGNDPEQLTRLQTDIGRLLNE